MKLMGLSDEANDMAIQKNFIECGRQLEKMIFEIKTELAHKPVKYGV
jgi:hypothetical protein